MLLTIKPRLFIRPLTLSTEILIVWSLILLAATTARAADPFAFNLLLAPEQGQDNTYRKDNHDKTIRLMLYGLQGTQQGDTDSIIPKDKKALNAFFKQHMDSIRHDYLGDDKEGMQVKAGEESFTSHSIDRNIEVDAAKMVGLTLPVGKVTVGGGYTWGEKNPALMLKTTEGFFAGASYDMGRTGFQVSYLTSGQKVMGFDVGGTDIHYSSILVGTSFRVNNRMGLTATAQYRQDDDPLTRGDQQAVFTVGTRWKF